MTRIEKQVPVWARSPLAAAALGPEPTIHPTAHIRRSRFGTWTEIGAYASVVESVVGDYSYLASSFVDAIYSRIGKFTSIASHVRINPGNHPMNRATQHHCTYRRRQYRFAITDDASVFQWRKSAVVTLEHDVWIGHGAVVMPGVNVGTGAVVGAGAVVTKDVAPYTIVAGVPAKRIGRRFDEQTAERLLALAWWNWDHATLRQRLEEFSDVDVFLEKYSA